MEEKPVGRSFRFAGVKILCRGWYDCFFRSLQPGPDAVWVRVASFVARDPELHRRRLAPLGWQERPLSNCSLAHPALRCEEPTHSISVRMPRSLGRPILKCKSVWA